MIKKKLHKVTGTTKSSEKKFPTKASVPQMSAQMSSPAQAPQPGMPMGRPDTPLAATPDPQQIM